MLQLFSLYFYYFIVNNYKKQKQAYLLIFISIRLTIYLFIVTKVPVGNCSKNHLASGIAN